MRSRLATRFSVSILGVVALAIVSSLVTLYAAWRVNVRVGEANRANLSSAHVEEVESMLLEANNLIASRLLQKGDSAAEENVRALKPRFRDWINAARSSPSVSDEEKELLLRLENTWTVLDERREEVLELGKKGEVERAKDILLREVIGRLSPEAHTICGQLVAVHEHSSRASISRAIRRVRLTTWAVGISSGLTLLLGGFLLWLFFYRVLFPLRGLVADAQIYHGNRHASVDGSENDELRTVGNQLRTLMSDVSDTRSRLERSRNQLLAAEKLASVGKIAASVAHEIRNPLTAMKMWLFSIQDAVQGNADLLRKLRIISEEICHLENVVRNLLEFSRPSTLHCQAQDMAAIMDRTIELLEPRFRGEKIRVTRVPQPTLPLVMGDAAQLKQVFLNLLGNAADAMGGGGEIRIALYGQRDADGRAMVVMRVCDSGPGMSPDIQCRIFEPFFTTKEKGTGLGLCIAAQIVTCHGGELVLESSTDKGTTFAVWMPIAPEDRHGQDSSS